MIMTRIIDAIIYLKPEKIIGGISSKPNLMITQDDDHRTVTNRACVTAMRYSMEKLFLIDKDYFPIDCVNE